MLRILLLLLALTIGSTAVVAQTTESLPILPTDLPPEAKKIYEVGLTTREHLTALFDVFLQGELRKDPTAQGYIINYGADREAARTESYIRSLVSLRKFAPSRIKMIRGGFSREMKTEFWLIPSGGFPPALDWRAHKIDFFGKIAPGEFKKRFVNYLVRLREPPTGTGYIVIDGADNYAAAQRKLILEIMRVRRFVTERIVIIRGDTSGKPQTQLWLLPAGATADEMDVFRRKFEKPPTERGTR